MVSKLTGMVLVMRLLLCGRHRLVDARVHGKTLASCGEVGVGGGGQRGTAKTRGRRQADERRPAEGNETLRCGASQACRRRQTCSRDSCNVTQ
jgi:hypothetical protein